MPRCGPSSSRRSSSRCFPDARCSVMARSGAAKRDADESREGRADASGARAHASLRDRRHHRHRRRRAEDPRHQGRHAHRHRAPLQHRLRRNRARQSGRRSVAAGREPRDRHSVAVHPAQRAARGHRHQRRGDATLLLPEGEEGRAAGGAHLSHRHRQGGLEDAGGRDEDRSPHEGSGLAADGVDHQGASRRARREARAVVGRGSGQSARPLRVLSRLAHVHDPRHQQARRRGPALEPRLHSPVSRKTSRSCSRWRPSARRCAW